MKLLITTIAIFAIILGAGVTASTILYKTSSPPQQVAQATGGAGEIKGLIDPIIERAITALQQNNTDLALEEITNLKNELADTFKADESEEEED